MVSSLISGCVYGLSAGLAPGPLLTLTLVETIRRGARAGIRVAVAPLITDAPILALTFLVITRFSGFEFILGLLSCAGAVFVACLGWGSVRTKGIETETAGNSLGSLRKAIIVNFLNPHPYLFWFTVGAPIALTAYERSPTAAVIFVTGFYVFLVGSKIILALLAARSRAVLKGKGYVFTMRVLGVVLLTFAFLLARDGLHLLRN